MPRVLLFVAVLVFVVACGDTPLTPTPIPSTATAVPPAPPMATTAPTATNTPDAAALRQRQAEGARATMVAGVFGTQTALAPSPTSTVPPTVPVPTVLPTPIPAPGTSVTLQGVGNQRTQPFSLSGGNYTVNWECINSDPLPRNFIVDLLPVDAPAFRGQSLTNAIIGARTDQSGRTAVYRVSTGQWYLDVTTIVASAWTITLTHQP